MLHRTERTLENLPVGPLGFIPIDGCQELGKKVDNYLVEWRKENTTPSNDDAVFVDYLKDSYVIDTKVPRNRTISIAGIHLQKPPVEFLQQAVPA